MSQRGSLLFFTFLICADIHLANTRSSKKQQHTCTYEQQVNVAIEFKESKARGAKLLDAVTQDTLDNCQENCCQHNGCTLALFHYTNATENCYIIRCHPPDVCSYTNLDSFSISNVTRDHEESDTDVEEEEYDTVKEYDTVTWPEWPFDGEDDTVTLAPNSTSDQLLSSSEPALEIPSTPETSPALETIPPATTQDSLLEEGTTPETAEDKRTTLPSSVAPATSSPVEQETSSSSYLSLSETSSISNPTVSSGTINYPSSSSLPLQQTTGGSSSSTPLVSSESGEPVSTPLVTASITGDSYVSVTDEISDVTGTEQQATATPAPAVSTATPAPAVSTTHVPTTTELPAQQITTQQHTTNKEVITETNQITKQITSTSTQYVTELISDTGGTTNLHKNVNVTTNPNLKGEVTYNKLSSNGALIASLCFGVLFACAVCVLLGKGWYEGYQRRHYSKVDYLINGMYN